MKQILRKTLLILLGGVMSTVAWAQDAGSYIYFNDFETIDGTGKIATASKGTVDKLNATIQGSGSFANEGGVYGKVFQNVGGELRTNYLKLPTDVFSHMAVSKQLTIGVWVKQTAAVDFYWAPILAAYGAAPSGSNGTPMLWCCANKLLQYNMGDGNWCDFLAAQCAGGSIDETSAWLDDNQWHYYTVTFNDKTAKVFIDGVLKNTWVLDDVTDGQKISSFYANGGNLAYVCLGGNQRWDGAGTFDHDPAFSFDDILITNIALTEKDIARVMNNKKDKATFFSENKGDLTSLINGDFEEHAFGWTGGTWRGNWDDFKFSWRGNDTPNYYYEIHSGANGSMTYTLSNMPAGTYKVVAASHASVVNNDITITASVAGTSGTPMTAKGCGYVAGNSEINTNGVQMPNCYNVGGFTEDVTVGRNWQWISAQGTLAADGDLVISFTVAGNTGDAWVSIDDVHLYHMDECISLGVLSSNPAAVNNNTKTVTCDLILSNPNVVIRTQGGKAIATASGDMNNNIYNSGGKKMSKMVLYDGYAYADYDTSEPFTVSDATLYRTIPADQWCTLMVPFYPTNLDVMKVPSATDATTVTFVDAPTTEMNNKPMIVKSTAGVTKITGVRNGTYGTGYGDGTSGTGATMVGTYTDIAAVANDNYILAHPASIDKDVLLKVNSAVGLKPFRAYFTIPATARTLDIDFDNETTGINMVNGEGLKVNGSDVYYNLQGQRVLYPTKGLYIVNGHKVVIK